MKTVNNRDVFRIRKQLDLTQTKFAALLGYTNYRRISELESGKASLSKRAEIILRFLDKKIKKQMNQNAQ